MTTFLGYPTTAAFLADCEQVRQRAVEKYRVIDTPATIRARQRTAALAAGSPTTWGTP